MEKFDKRMNKMDSETLQQFLAFRKRAGRVPSKKGKGSYNRKRFKAEVAQNKKPPFLFFLLGRRRLWLNQSQNPASTGRRTGKTAVL